jgi:hypothetical protein
LENPGKDEKMWCNRMLAANYRTLWRQKIEEAKAHFGL